MPRPFILCFYYSKTDTPKLGLKLGIVIELDTFDKPSSRAAIQVKFFIVNEQNASSGLIFIFFNALLDKFFFEGFTAFILYERKTLSK